MSAPARVVEPPHTLVVTASGAALVCPHVPPSLAMPCASLVPCYCDIDAVDVDGFCPVSPHGEHEYVAATDELYYLAAQCWAVGHRCLDDALPEQGLAVGRYQVWPICEDDRLTVRWTPPPPGAPS